MLSYRVKFPEGLDAKQVSCLWKPNPVSKNEFFKDEHNLSRVMLYASTSFPCSGAQNKTESTLVLSLVISWSNKLFNNIKKYFFPDIAFL